LASFLQSCTALEQLRLLVVSQQVAHVRVLVTHRPPALRSIELSSFKLDRLLEIHHDMLTFAADVKRSVAQHRVTGTETLVPQDDRISIELLGRLISNQPAGLRRLVLGGTTCTLHSDDDHQAGLGRTAVCAQCGVALNAETTPTIKNKSKTAMTSSQPNMTAGAKSEAGRSEQPRKLPASWRAGGSRGRGKQDAPKSRSRDASPKKSAGMRKGKASLVAVVDDLDDEVEDIDTTDDDDVEDKDEQREVSRAEPQQQQQQQQQAPWNGFTRHKSFSFAVVPKEVAPAGGQRKRGPGATSASAPVATTGPNSIIMTRGKVPLSVRCLCTAALRSYLTLVHSLADHDCGRGRVRPSAVLQCRVREGGLGDHAPRTMSGDPPHGPPQEGDDPASAADVARRSSRDGRHVGALAVPRPHAHVHTHPPTQLPFPPVSTTPSLAVIRIII
jgi:hypothetical protein